MCSPLSWPLRSCRTRSVLSVSAPGAVADAVEAWAFTAAVVRLLRSWLAAQDFETALAEATSAVEETTHTSGRSRKRTTGRRVQSALDALHRAETPANNLRRELGLTPSAVTRMGLDIGEKKDSLMHQLLRLQVEQRDDDGQDSPDT
jgi:hypothetical protein